MKKIVLFFATLFFAVSYSSVNAQAPTVPASNFQFGTIGTTSLSMTWTRGNGDKCLVVCRPTANSASLPINANDYTPSTVYGSGSHLGNGNYVCYEGTGTSVTITGLTSNTQYTIRVYEFNIDWLNVEYYLTSSYATGTHYTLTTQPTTAPTGLTAYNLAPTTSYFSWTPGNGSYTIFGLRQSTTVSGSPTDGTEYYSSGSFGSGDDWGSLPYTYSIYDGSSSSGIYAYNLSPATNYTGTAFSYNGVSGANNYLTSPYATVQFTTLATEPTASSTDLYITDRTDNAMTINWMKPANSGSYSLVTVKAGATNSNLPVDMTVYTANTIFGSGSQVGSGAYVVYNGSGNSVRITGLTAGSSYAVSVFEFNGGVGTYNNTTNYLTSSYQTVSTSTNDPEPTTTASSLILTPSTHSVTANWTNGNGAKRLVAVRPSRIKTALSFDGVNDYVNCGTNSVLRPTSAVTVEAWANKANWNTFGGWQVIAGNYETGGYSLFVYDNYIYGVVRRNGVDAYVYASVAHLSPGWHHFAMTFDGRYEYLYVDGAKQGLNDALSYYSLQYSYSNSLLIGAEVGTTSTPTGYYFSGYIDNVRIWSTARSASQIQSNMWQNVANNSSGLLAEWMMDDGFVTTSTVKNASLISSLNGTMVNMTTTAASSFTGSSGWIRSGAPVDSPVDFNNYTGISTFMIGTQVNRNYYTVLSSTGNSVTVTGLSPNTYYNFCVYEYNETAARNFQTSTYLTGDVLTTGVAAPTITAVSPAFGTVGTLVTLTGTNFSSTPSNNTVFFGAEKATVVSSTTTQIVAIAPYCTNYAPISVTVSNVTGYSNVPFIINSSCAAVINSGSFTGTATSTGTQRMGLTSSDIDVDGKADLIYVDFQASTFTLLRNTSSNGTVSWGITNTYSTSTGPVDVQCADFDGDGKPDPMVVCYTTGTINLYKNYSNVNFFSMGTKFELPVNPFPWACEVADFDRDGRPDIVVVNSSGASITIYRNKSTIGYFDFDDAVTISGFADANNVAVGDMNNDGKTDILVGDRTNNGFYVLENNCTAGNITFLSADFISTTSGVQEIVVGDLNNNGKLDVGVALTNNTVRLYNNINAGGTIVSGDYSLSATLTTLSSTPIALEFNDLDGDNRPDVVVGYSTSNNISVFEHTATYTFAARVDYAGTGSNSGWLTVNDFSIDGKSDIISTNSASTYTIYNNAMNVLSAEPSIATSGISFSGVSQNQLTINFTPGSGSDRIIIASQGAPVSVLPFDGVGYTPNSVFGSGTDLGGGNYVVYNGNGNSAIVTGLLSNTAYYFAIFEYNGATNCQNNYLTSSFGSSNTTTLNTPPTINVINNPSTICQNSGLQNMALSGIGTGAGHEVQTISVTATSNNQTLLPNGNISVTYTSPNATGTVNYTTAANQSGTAIVTVTVNDNASNNNITTRTFTVTVNAPPSTSNAGSNQNICTPSTVLAANTPGVGTGTWSFIYTSNGAITISNLNSPTSSINNFNPGDSVRLQWTISNSPCANSTSQMSIKRGTCPLDAEFSANQTNFCGSSANVTYTNLSTCQLPNTIVSYNWSFPGGTPNSATGAGPHTVAYISSGTYNAQLIVTDNNGTTNTELKTNYIVITALPAAATPPTGNNPVCQGETSRTYSVTPIAGATSYQWSVPANATIVSGQGTPNIVVDYGTNATTGNVTVHGVNSCGNGTSNLLLVTVNPLPANTGTITGPTNVCQGQNGVPFSVAPINNATGYNWTLPTGATIITGNNTNSITVNFASNASSGTVNVVGTNSCGNGISNNSYTLTVNPLPGTAGLISGPAIVCQNDTVSYSISPVNNATGYNWTIPSGATIISGNNTTSVTVAFGTNAVSGNVTVNGVNACGNGTNNSLAITVNPLPGAATSINGNNTICAGDNNELFFVSNIANATGYVWTLPPGFTILSGNNTNGIVVSLSPTAQSGTVSVYGTNGCGSGTSSSISVTVTPLPDSAGAITGNASVCQGQQGVVYTVPSITNATGYNWTVPSGVNIISGNNTNSITVDFSITAVSGNIIVIGTNTCGNGLAADTFAVTVNPLPGAAGVIVGDSAINICPTIQTGVVYSIPSVPNATGYNWTVPIGATIVNGNNTNTITVDYSTGAQSGTITVTPTNACGTGTQSTHNIVVDTVISVNVCMVTVDPASNYNRVIWEKPATAQLDSFRIYREIGNQFVHIGSVHYDSLSIYVDSIYQPIANPNNTNYRYKIAAVDTCGNVSEISTHHRTIFLQANQGVGGVVNLNWIPYEGNTVTQYYIYRDTTGTGNLILLDSVPGMNTVYTDNNPSTQVTTLRYVLGVDWQTTCNPTFRSGGGNSILAAINSSSSNIKNLFYDPNSSVQDLENHYGLVIYPNPNNGEFQITFKDRSVQSSEVKITDAVGQLIYKQDLGSNKNGAWYTSTIDISQMANGVYFVQVEINGNRITKKLVIQK